MTFTIGVPAPDGFVGRACPSESCGQYFKVALSDHQDMLSCPYCGEEFNKHALHTRDQMDFVREAAREEVRQCAVAEVQKMLSRTFGSASARRSGITYKPGRHPKRIITPQYTERTVDTQLECPTCSTRFQVYGIFGYCPGCREENLQLYDANWAIIQRELENAENPQRDLRHAYSDLVSTFETFCNRKAERLSSDHPSFQDLFDARKFFKRHLSIDILADIADAQLLDLRRAIQKRHVYIHEGGKITDRYVRKIPEDSHLLGQQAELNLTELQSAANGVRIALGGLVRAMEARG